MFLGKWILKDDLKDISKSFKRASKGFVVKLKKLPVCIKQTESPILIQYVELKLNSNSTFELELN